MRRRFRLLDMDRQDVAVLYRCAHIAPDSVQENTLVHFLKLRQILIGIAAAAQVLFDAKPRGCVV